MRADLEAIDAASRKVLDAKYRAREIGLTNSRQAIRRCANSIRALHRGEAERAEELMVEASDLLAEAAQKLEGHPDILHAGFLSDACKEYAEARLFQALAAGKPLPLPEDLQVWVVPYLHGLGEAAGEMRRRMLDLLRAGDLESAEAALEAMDGILELLAGLDYPDGMTSGLRRTTDVTRALIERSRSDLTTTVIQERLRRSLEDAGGS